MLIELLRRLFRTPPSVPAPTGRLAEALPQPAPIEAVTTKSEADWLGPDVVYSPDRTCRLTWQDLDLWSEVHGRQKRVRGGFQLFKADTLLCTGELERPFAGKVANDGTVILNDWLFGEGTKGAFAAFLPDGTQLVRRRFQANLGLNAISPDGHFAVCSTYVADSDDSELLAFFSLKPPRLVWRRPIEPAYPDGIEIATDDERILLAFNGLGTFAWSFQHREQTKGVLPGHATRGKGATGRARR